MELFTSFISRTFVRSVWELEYLAFQGSDEEKALEERLLRWSRRKDLRETSAEAAFIEEFFRDIGDTFKLVRLAQRAVPLRSGQNSRSPISLK